MDIEGAEAEAVYGMQELIDKSPNLIVMQEWSPTWLNDTKKYLDFWRSRGYKIAQIHEDYTIVEMSDSELINSPQIDIILAKDSTVFRFKKLD